MVSSQIYVNAVTLGPRIVSVKKGEQVGIRQPISASFVPCSPTNLENLGRDLWDISSRMKVVIMHRVS